MIIEVLRQPLGKTKYDRNGCCCFQFVDLCGCVDSQYNLSPGFMTENNYTQCTSYTTTSLTVDEQTRTIRNLYCGLKATTFVLNIDDCQHSCAQPCTDCTYDTSVSVSGPWPHQAHLKTIYAKYINGTYIEQDFNKVSRDVVQCLALQT